MPKVNVYLPDELAEAVRTRWKAGAAANQDRPMQEILTRLERIEERLAAR